MFNGKEFVWTEYLHLQHWIEPPKPSVEHSVLYILNSVFGSHYSWLNERKKHLVFHSHETNEKLIYIFDDFSHIDIDTMS